MSRITLTRKANGRYYVGMDATDFAILKEIVKGVDSLAKEANWSSLARDSVSHFHTVLQKPARGEA